jgi:hypothetical protein
MLNVRQSASVNTKYQLQIKSGAASVLFRYVSNSATLIATFATLTVTAGDVFVLQAAGSVLSVYQNWNLVGFVADAMITSGSPGIEFFATTAVTRAQISSWRGYNNVQRDGIWQKQGVILPALSGDLGANLEGLQNICILPSSHPVILSGQVLKGWFQAGTTINTDYAESPITDGQNWTRHSGHVISGVGLTPSVIEVGSTYHYYGQASYGAAVQHWTSPSTDGLVWTLVNATMFSKTNLVYFSVVAIIAGTWYALYTISAGTFPSTTNLATSTDGDTWTDYGSNPVASNFWGIVKATKVGSLWYAWGQTAAPGQGSAKPGIDPGEGLRMQTADFITWANPVHSAHHSQLFEGVNGVKGGNYVSYPININGKAYLYSTTSLDDVDTTSQMYQLALAIAPAPIASIIAANEDGLQQVATDAFTSGAGDLSANWTLPTGGTKLKIVAGPFVEPTATSTVCQAVYTGASFSPNQYSTIVLQALTGTLAQSLVWPTVLSSTTALTNYEGRIASPSGTSDAAASIWKRVAGTPAQLGPTATIDPVVGDSFTISSFVGSDGFPVLSLFQNGYLILQVQDQSATPLTTGNPGIQAESVLAIADAQIASWAGGNANVIPNYPPLNSQYAIVQSIKSHMGSDPFGVSS